MTQSMDYKSGFALPKSFCVEKEGGKIFIFKEGYRDLVGASTDTYNQQPANGFRQSKGRNQMAEGRKQGRGEYPCVPLEGGGTAIVRRVRHGGLWGKVMGDTLWGVGRPVRELINANKALERGIPTAEILGVRLERRIVPFLGVALPLFRAEMFSKELAGTIDLLQLLSLNALLTQSMDSKKNTPLSALGESMDSKRREIVRAVALAVRAMHEGGLYHNDLHLKNILVSRSASGGPFKAYVIDLDKSSLHESLSLDQRIKNLLRLDRSVEKFMTARGRFQTCPYLITRRDKLRFLRDYSNRNPRWKDLARGLNPGHTFHRWWWKLLGTMGVDAYSAPLSAISNPKTED